MKREKTNERKKATVEERLEAAGFERTAGGAYARKAGDSLQLLVQCDDGEWKCFETTGNSSITTSDMTGDDVVDTYCGVVLPKKHVDSEDILEALMGAVFSDDDEDDDDDDEELRTVTVSDRWGGEYEIDSIDMGILATAAQNAAWAIKKSGYSVDGGLDSIDDEYLEDLIDDLSDIAMCLNACRTTEADDDDAEDGIVDFDDDEEDRDEDEDNAARHCCGHCACGRK